MPSMRPDAVYMIVFDHTERSLSTVEWSNYEKNNNNTNTPLQSNILSQSNLLYSQTYRIK